MFALMGFAGYELTTLLSAESELSQSGVEVVVTQQEYKAGDVVRFTIRNRTAASVFVVNNCPDVPLEAYRQEAGEWVRLHKEADASKCLGEPSVYEVATQSEVSATYRFWPDLFSQPGRYRLVVPLAPEQTANTASSSSSIEPAKPAVEFDVVAR